MSDILTLFTDNDAKATFFFNGNNYDCIYTEDNVKRVQYAVQHGHQIASHTWSHPRLTQLNTDQIREEFSQIDDAILKITGLIPAFMRPPYGEYSDDVRMVAAERGQSLAIWDNDTGDSSGLSLDQQKAVYDEFVSRKADQGIFLQHEVHDTTVHDLVPYAISKLKRAGYHMVTLAECLGQDAYQGAAVRLAERDDSWNCS